MPQLDFPTTPSAGQVYSASNGVDYTWNATVGVWTAAPGTPLTITSPGSISGVAEVGATLTYTTGTATGGVAPYTPSWDWKKISDNSVVQSGGATYVIAPALLGDNVYVELTITDSAANSATAVTTTFPVPPAVIQPAGITGAVAPTTIPGTASFTWADGATTLSASGCIEFSVDAGANWTQAATSVNNTTTVQTRWVNVPSSGTCGDSAGNATITGTLTDSGGATTTFSFTMDRTPDAFSLSPNTETTTPSTVTTTDPTFTIAGTNSPSFIWGAFGTTGGTPEFTVDAGTTWLPIPAAPGSATVDPGANVSIRFTTGAAAGTEVYTVNVGASTTAGEFQSGAFTVTVASTPFPGLSFSPAGGPNASPASVSVAGPPALEGTATATWPAASPNPASLTVTGDIQIDINSGGFVGAGGPYAINTGESLDVIWDPAAVAAAADGATLTGSITDVTYTNTFSLLVDKQPTFTLPADPTGAALSTQQTTSAFTPTAYNAPVTVSFTNPTTAGSVAMVAGTIQAIVNGGPATNIVLGTTTITLNPGDSLEILGDTGGANSTTYGLTVTMGAAAAQEWLVTTIAVTPAIATPSISSPSGAGAVGINPAVNSPAGITLQTTSAYTPSGGAGLTQTSSEWEVYKWTGGGAATAPTTDPPGANYTAIAGSPFSNTTSPFTSQFIAQSAFTVSSTYYARLRYRTANATATDSAWSAWAEFSTASSFTIPPGTPMGGGYFGGQINDGGTIYNLIVAPVTSGGLDGQYGGASATGIQWRNTATPETGGNISLAQDTAYGKPWTDAAAAIGPAGTYPLFEWCVNSVTGPNGGAGIGGFTDWYIPAKNELAILYFFLKPTIAVNDTSSGSNANSVAPYTPNTNYGPGFPNVTSSALFAGGGAQTFNTINGYWSSTEYSGNTNYAWKQTFFDGLQNNTNKDSLSFLARAVRRISA